MSTLQKFLDYDFGKDEKYSEYLSELEFSKYPIGFMLKKLQMKYFCRFIDTTFKYEDLLNQYLANNDNKQQNSSSNQNSQDNQGNQSENSSGSSTSNNDSSSNRTANQNYQQNVTRFGFGNRAFTPWISDVNSFTIQDRVNILIIQLVILVLGPLSLFFRGKFYFFFGALSVFVNGKIAYSKTRSLKKFLLLQERGHYALLSLFMLVQPISFLFILLMMMIAFLDLVDYSPTIFSGNAFFQQKIQPFIQTINKYRHQYIEIRIPFIEIFIYFSTYLQLNLLRILMMMNLLSLRYIQSNNIALILDFFIQKIDFYLQKIPILHNAFNYIRKYVSLYVSNLREALEKLSHF